MRFLILLLIGFLPVFATNLLTYNIYERTDRVDIMLSFDTPYDGNIFQKREDSSTSLILNSLKFDKNLNLDVNSDIVNRIQIESKNNSLILKLNSKNPIALNASKTTDGFGLRIRVSPVALKNNHQLPQADIKLGADVSTTDDIIDTKYYLVLVVLLALLVFLFIFKKMMMSKATSGTKTNGSFSWLTKGVNSNVQILHERYLDRQNKLILLEFDAKRYLVIVGTTNIILDKITGEESNSEEEFSAFFEENKKRLGMILQQRQNSLNNYKDKMSME